MIFCYIRIPELLFSASGSIITNRQEQVFHVGLPRSVLRQKSWAHSDASWTSDGN